MWYSLKPYIPIAKSFSVDVNRLKDHYASTNYLNKDSHYIGKLGECLFANRFNLEVNTQVTVKGDNGFDFLLNGNRIDVKTTPYFRYPELKEHPFNLQSADYYVLVAIDEERCLGRLVGYCSGLRLISEYPVSYRGLGLRHVMPARMLSTDWASLIGVDAISNIGYA